LVPLSRLVPRRSGRNVRKTPRMSIPELAASIARVGLLQNLIVIPPPMASITKWWPVAAAWPP
jgi:ParB family chromosome partitioning protein